ncbi:E3 ubiquitin-protein ligase RLIM-like protein [Drosera capensis]
MGSATSRHRSHHPPRATHKRVSLKRALSSLPCAGASSSRATGADSEPVDYPAESLVNSTERSSVVTDSRGLTKESIFSWHHESGLRISEVEPGVSATSTSDQRSEQRFSDADSSIDGKHIGGVISSHGMSGESNHILASTHCRRPSQNVASDVYISDRDDSRLHQRTAGAISRNDRVDQEESSTQLQGAASDGYNDGQRGITDFRVPYHPSLNIRAAFESLEDYSMPSGNPTMSPDSTEDIRERGSLQSNMRRSYSGALDRRYDETGDIQVRSDGRRMVRDAFSIGSFRSSGLLPPTEESDNIGSRHGLLIEMEDNLGSGTGGGFSRFGRRSHLRSGQLLPSRSQLLSSSRGDLDDETDAQLSISRIVLLAEALHEVLDEIHRHPSPFSWRIVSSPAPELVVDSLPLRVYKNSNAVQSEEDAEQCYICLAVYEVDDQIRTLPCYHEYHMLCVDKWLKEIHGVCPLCRGDVSVSVEPEPINPDAILLPLYHE